MGPFSILDLNILYPRIFHSSNLLIPGNFESNILAWRRAINHRQYWNYGKMFKAGYNSTLGRHSGMCRFISEGWIDVPRSFWGINVGLNPEEANKHGGGGMHAWCIQIVRTESMSVRARGKRISKLLIHYPRWLMTRLSFPLLHAMHPLHTKSHRKSILHSTLFPLFHFVSIVFPMSFSLYFPSISPLSLVFSIIFPNFVPFPLSSFVNILVTYIGLYSLAGCKFRVRGIKCSGWAISVPKGIKNDLG